MERRLLLASFLTLIVIYGYQLLFVKAPQPGASTPSTQAETTAVPGAATAAAQKSAAPGQPSEGVSQQAEATVSEPMPREVVVETAEVQAVLSNKGAQVLHWRLKNYKDTNGQPVDLVPSDVPASEPKPFALALDDSRLTALGRDAVYRVTGDTAGRVDATTTPRTLVFEYADSLGFHVRKEFGFEPATYIVQFSAVVSNGSTSLNPTVQLGPSLGDLTPQPSNTGFFRRATQAPPEALVHTNGKVTRTAFGRIAPENVQEGAFRFVGVDDLYFMAAVVGQTRTKAVYRPLTVPVTTDTQRQLIAASFKFDQSPSRVRFFIGPKQFDLLQRIDSELVRAVNFGIFGWLAVPLLGGLKWLHGFTGNWGWSIVLLTVLINLAIFPLRHKSVVSMRRMQEIQPQLKAIQDRYSALKVTDPARQKMNEEIMALYRQKGANPASGCVPMLLTIPVLFAFYALLSQAIELRGAPFAGWITDLSRPDPLFVFPLLVTITMVWQQRLTPTTMDPAQQRIMMFMPVMFGFIFLTTAAGTVLYWFVSNLWAIGQQYFTTWLIGPPAIPVQGAAAERRMKSAGGGKSSGAQKQA